MTAAMTDADWERKEEARVQKLEAIADSLRAEIALALMAAGLEIEVMGTLQEEGKTLWVPEKGRISAVDGVSVEIKVIVVESWRRAEKSRVKLRVERERVRIYPIDKEGKVNVAKLVQAVKEDVAASKKRDAQRVSARTWEQRSEEVREAACAPLRAYLESKDCDGVSVDGFVHSDAFGSIQSLYVGAFSLRIQHVSLDEQAVREIVDAVARSNARREGAGR